MIISLVNHKEGVGKVTSDYIDPIPTLIGQFMKRSLIIKTFFIYLPFAHLCYLLSRTIQGDPSA